MIEVHRIDGYSIRIRIEPHQRADTPEELTRQALDLLHRDELIKFFIFDGKVINKPS